MNEKRVPPKSPHGIKIHRADSVSPKHPSFATLLGACHQLQAAANAQSRFPSIAPRTDRIAYALGFPQTPFLCYALGSMASTPTGR